MGHMWKLKTPEETSVGDRVKNKNRKIRRGILVYFKNPQVIKNSTSAEPNSECSLEGCSKPVSGPSDNPEDSSSSPGIEMVVIVHSGH